MTRKRRLATIMFTDLVGYTAAMERDERQAHALAERAHEHVRAFVERCGGRWVETVGDGSLSTFDSASRAVDCALAIQDSLASDPELQLRIGLHLGDVVFSEEGVYGNGVNVASRVHALAPPGGTVVTEAIRSAIRGYPKLGFSPLGKKQLKNVQEPLYVYLLITGNQQTPRALARHRVTISLATVILIAVIAGFVVLYTDWSISSQKSEAASSARSKHEASQTNEKTLAVLPFENLSGNPEDRYIADGVAEEIHNLLSHSSELRVISRSSAFTFRDSNLAIPVFAEKLGATHVLEGSIRRSGPRIRVTAQLIDSERDSQIWSKSFNRSLGDLFVLQEQLAVAIADSLEVSIQQPGKRMDGPGTTYELIVQARAATANRARANIARAIQLLQKATRLNPDSAEAWGQLAYAHLLNYYWVQTEVGREAIRFSAEKALALDSRNVSALTAIASYHMFMIHLDEANQLFRKALEINPNSLPANNWYGDFLKGPMCSQDAIRYEMKATQLDPLGAAQFYDLGTAYKIAERNTNAIDAYNRSLDLDPGFGPSVVQLFRLYSTTGNDASILELKTSFSGTIEATVNWLAEFYVAIARNDRKKAREKLAKMGDYDIRLPGGQTANLAILQADLGDFDHASQMLASYEKDYPLFIFCALFPTDPEILEAHPQYAEYWRQAPRDRLLKARGHWIWDKDQESTSTPIHQAKLGYLQSDVGQQVIVR